jgi:hypothetical protein
MKKDDNYHFRMPGWEAELHAVIECPWRDLNHIPYDYDNGDSDSLDLQLCRVETGVAAHVGRTQSKD